MLFHSFYAQSNKTDYFLRKLSWYDLASAEVIKTLGKNAKLVKQEPDNKIPLENLIQSLSDIRKQAEQNKSKLKVMLKEDGEFLDNFKKLHPEKTEELQTLSTKLKSLEQQRKFYCNIRSVPFLFIMGIGVLAAALACNLLLFSTVPIMNIVIFEAFLFVGGLIDVALGLIAIFVIQFFEKKIEESASAHYDVAIQEARENIKNLTKEEKDPEVIKGVKFAKREGIDLDNIDKKFDDIIKEIDKRILLYQNKLDDLSLRQENSISFVNI